MKVIGERHEEMGPDNTSVILKTFIEMGGQAKMLLEEEELLDWKALEDFFLLSIKKENKMLLMLHISYLENFFS